MTVALALNRSTFLTALQQVRPVLRQAMSDFLGKASAKAGAVFKQIQEKVESLEIPIEAAGLALEWAGQVEVLHDKAEVLAERLGQITAPFALILMVAKVKNACKTFFGTRAEGADAPKLAGVMSMGFALVSSACCALSWMQKMGMISPALALAGRASLFGGLCNLAASLIDLKESVKDFSITPKMLKALFNTAIALISVVLLAYTAAYVQLLLLTLGTGSLILNAVAPDSKEIQ